MDRRITDTTPKYLAIAAGFADLIRSGDMPAGTRLPPQRQLALERGVDLTTVTRAYTELKRMGLVEGRPGSGSFVRAAVAVAGGSAGFDLSMNVPPQPAGLGDRIAKGIAELLATGGVAHLTYQPAGGVPRDREAAARWLKQRLGEPSPDRVIVAAGVQSALFALVDLLLRPGDSLACAALTYPGMKTIAAQRGLRLVGLAQDAEGLDPAAFEDLCRTAPPKALYLVPTIGNPTTATLPLGRRQAIVATARRHGVVLVEDDAYGALVEDSAPLAVLAPEITWHLATLSKCATPALRIAYVAAPDPHSALRLAAGLRAVSLMASPLTAALATHWIHDGTLGTLTAAIRAENRARQDLAREILRDAAIAAHPDGNHLWLTLPAGLDRTGFVAAAREAGLLVVASDAFDVTGAAPEAVRLSLGGVPDRVALRRALTLVAGLLSRPAVAAPAIV
ncbi:aminotransferase-like domain-containing protein [Inquilinus sp. CA228]|uniref:aminotransferase-like domain-containing protein n=1 Tax=Inquilinus sp. CA228 TaxID=3455609 RepID=UPI003F8D8384